MKIQNRNLKAIIEFLYNLKLRDQKSRYRSHFINMLMEKYEQYQQDHLQLVKEYSNLDENNNPIIIEVGGNQQYDVFDLVAFNSAYSELLNEEIYLDQNQGNKKMLLSLQDSIYNCGLDFQGDDAHIYDIVCDAFDQVHDDLI